MADVKSVEEMAAEEATKSRLLVLPGERTLGFRDMLLIQVSFGVATWMLVYGAYVGFGVPFWPALIAAVVGSSLPLCFHGWIAKMHARWGIDASILTRVTWGTLGAVVTLPFFLFISYLVWTSIPIVMFGRATSVGLSYLHVHGFLGDARLWSILGLFVGMLVLWRGAAVLYWFFRFVTPTIVVLEILLTYKIISQYGFNALTSIVPAGYSKDHVLSYMIATEITMGGGFSWIYCYGIYCRLAKSESAALYGPTIAWGPIFGLLTAPAIFGALAIGATDPVYMLEKAGGGWIIAYVAFLFGANIFSAVCTMYIVSLAARTLWPRMPWLLAVGLNVFVIIFVFWSPAYDQFYKFVSLIGATFGPFGVIMVVDYFLRGFKVNLREAYTQRKGNGYWYFWGFNIPAFISLGCGSGFYFWIYNPLTSVVHHPGIFKFAGGAIPASFIAGAVYLVLARLVLVPNGVGFPAVPRRGGERAPEGAVAVPGMTLSSEGAGQK
jgi:purine-cytosine permease-like protein